MLFLVPAVLNSLAAGGGPTTSSTIFFRVFLKIMHHQGTEPSLPVTLITCGPHPALPPSYNVPVLFSNGPAELTDQGTSLSPRICLSLIDPSGVWLATSQLQPKQPVLSQRQQAQIPTSCVPEISMPAALASVAACIPIL